MNSGRSTRSHATDQTRCKVWLFRTLAVLCGLSLFLVAELACVLCSLGEQAVRNDPFVGFSDLQPLFERDSQTGIVRTAEQRLKFFAEDSFPAKKAAGTFRVFCLGGSTVKGRPFSKETSFTTWLRLALETANPDRRFEVVNCGGISYASYRLVPVLQECLQYEPDLFIVCTGHNEFLEDRTYSGIRNKTTLLAGAHHTLWRLRSYRVVHSAFQSTGEAPSPETLLGSDVDAFLDYRNGLKVYHRDPNWHAGTIAHFRWNLERMCDSANAADVPLLFVLPPSNLADQPPFKSEHRFGLTDDETARFDDLTVRAAAAMSSGSSKAIELLEQARGIDPEFAELHYHLGRLYESASRFDDARREFVAAREHDICPLRILRPMEDLLREVSESRRVPLLDAHALLEARSKHGILGGSLLVDHVHPSFEGHQLIALALARMLAEPGHVRFPADSEAAARFRFDQHFNSLPGYYFADGQRNLENLRYWTRGEADGPDIDSRIETVPGENSR